MSTVSHRRSWRQPLVNHSVYFLSLTEKSLTFSQTVGLFTSYCWGDEIKGRGLNIHKGND